jgi:hypothetical protein
MRDADPEQVAAPFARVQLVQRFLISPREVGAFVVCVIKRDNELPRYERAKVCPMDHDQIHFAATEAKAIDAKTAPATRKGKEVRRSMLSVLCCVVYAYCMPQYKTTDKRYFRGESVARLLTSY